MTTCTENDYLAAYALHALEAGEEETVRTHLAQCQSCSHELDELASTVGYLDRLSLPDVETALDLEHLAPDPGPRSALPGRHSARKSRLVAASAVLAAVVGVGGAALMHSATGPARDATVHASDLTTGAVATLTAAQSGGMTRLHLSLHGVYPKGNCYLVAHWRNGKPQIVASWTASSWGGADVNAATAIPLDQLTDFDVVTASGHRLVQLAMPVNNT